MKWTIELSEYDLQFHPRIAIKAQALADFLAKLPNLELLNSTGKSESEVVWQVFVDGFSGGGGSRVEVLLIAPSREETRIAFRLNFKSCNNETEYEAVLLGLQAAKAVGATRVHINSDS